MERGATHPSRPLRLADVLILATSYALLCGLGEGAGLFFLQKGPIAGGTINIFLVPRGILYVSPLADLLVFVIVALLWAGISRIKRVSAPERVLLFLLNFMLVFDWLSLVLDRVLDPPYNAILCAGISAALTRVCTRQTARILTTARRALPALATAVVLAMCGVWLVHYRAKQAAAAGLPAAPVGAPNVLVVVMDTVRADHLSAFGYQRPTTPNLDRLAAQGVLFENAFSTSSWTLPAHASLLTGRFPFEHGAEVHAYDGRYPTLSEAFEARGYRTAAFSANTYYFSQPNGFGPGFQYFDGMFTRFGDVLSRPLYGRMLVMLYEENFHADLPGRKRAAEINGDFFHWLDADSTRPFFAVLNLFDAHAPYLPPAPFRDRFSVRPDPGGILNPWGDRQKLSRPEDTRDERDAYDGGIAYEDAQIGSLVKTLAARGLAENTLLVIVSDHGEFFGEHGLYMHQNALFLQGIHVPMLFRWPGHVPPGVRVANPVSIADVAATLTAMVPARRGPHFPGRSLSRFWEGSDAGDDGLYVLSELVARKPPPAGVSPRSESLLSARWHLLFTRGRDPQLFDWRSDPEEEHNLAASAEGRRVAAQMLSCVEDHLGAIRQPECGISARQPGGSEDSALAGEADP
jgi:arylsulfatase A-like enzyme